MYFISLIFLFIILSNKYISVLTNGVSQLQFEKRKHNFFKENSSLRITKNNHKIGNILIDGNDFLSNFSNIDQDINSKERRNYEAVKDENIIWFIFNPKGENIPTMPPLVDLDPEKSHTEYDVSVNKNSLLSEEVKNINNKISSELYYDERISSTKKSVLTTDRSRDNRSYDFKFQDYLGKMNSKLSTKKSNNNIYIPNIKDKNMTIVTLIGESESVNSHNYEALVENVLNMKPFNNYSHDNGNDNNKSHMEWFEIEVPTNRDKSRNIKYYHKTSGISKGKNKTLNHTQESSENGNVTTKTSVSGETVEVPYYNKILQKYLYEREISNYIRSKINHLIMSDFKILKQNLNTSYDFSISTNSHHNNTKIFETVKIWSDLLAQALTDEPKYLIKLSLMIKKEVPSIIIAEFISDIVNRNLTAKTSKKKLFDSKYTNTVISTMPQSDPATLSSNSASILKTLIDSDINTEEALGIAFLKYISQEEIPILKGNKKTEKEIHFTLKEILRKIIIKPSNSSVSDFENRKSNTTNEQVQSNDFSLFTTNKTNLQFVPSSNGPNYKAKGFNVTLNSQAAKIPFGSKFVTSNSTKIYSNSNRKYSVKSYNPFIKVIYYKPNFYYHSYSIPSQGEAVPHKNKIFIFPNYSGQNSSFNSIRNSIPNRETDISRNQDNTKFSKLPIFLNRLTTLKNTSTLEVFQDSNYPYQYNIMMDKLSSSIKGNLKDIALKKFGSGLEKEFVQDRNRNKFSEVNFSSSDSNVYSCGNIGSNETSIFRNPSYPSSDTTEGVCTFRLLIESPSAYQIRLDLVNTWLGTPVNGECHHQKLSISGSISSQDLPQICGRNKNFTMYITLDNQKRDRWVDFIMISTRANFPYKFEVKIRQMKLSDGVDNEVARQKTSNLAPLGCLQYFTDFSGVISSLNFDGGEYLNKMNYVICIKKSENACIANFFTLENEFGLQKLNSAIVPFDRAGVGNKACVRDYLFIPNIIGYRTTSSKRLCGSKLSYIHGDKFNRILTVAPVGEYFFIYVKTGKPSSYNPSTHGPGFRIFYTQQIC